MMTDKDILIKKGLTLALKEAKAFQLSIHALKEAFPDILARYDLENLANENFNMIREMCDGKRDLFDEDHPIVQEKLEKAHAMAVKDVQKVKAN